MQADLRGVCGDENQTFTWIWFAGPKQGIRCTPLESIPLLIPIRYSPTTIYAIYSQFKLHVVRGLLLVRRTWYLREMNLKLQCINWSMSIMLRDELVAPTTQKIGFPIIDAYSSRHLRILVGTDLNWGWVSRANKMCQKGRVAVNCERMIRRV